MYQLIEDCIFEHRGIIFGEYVKQHIRNSTYRRSMNILISSDNYEKILTFPTITRTGYIKQFSFSDIQLVKLLVHGIKSFHINVYHTNDPRDTLNFLRFPFEHDALTLSHGRRIGVLSVLLLRNNNISLSKVVNRIVSCIKNNRLCILDATPGEISYAHEKGYILMDAINNVSGCKGVCICCGGTSSHNMLEVNCCKELYHSECYLNLLKSVSYCPTCKIKHSQFRHLKSTYISIN
jgi:hypothetical protein